MTPPANDSFHDPYPIGWVLTYLSAGPVNGSGRYRIGVVTGESVRDARTGVETIPLAEAGEDTNGQVVWIRDDDVIGIEPRLRSRHG
ncbi:hypothetical protein [Amycolatopsis minnesotensis]|uniref:hypothetical protein n=1 Tax=Amycolatopsis minnesotensis TaxID=337894 RepID=UPI0031DC9230